MATSQETAELLAQLDERVEEIRSGEDWQHMLLVQSKLYRYSFGNQLLIMLQNPEASMVAGYRAWQGMGHQVRKGEHGIRILAPCVVKDRSATPEDISAGRKSGRVLVGFRSTSVFDISQTDGPPMPETPALLEGEAPQGAWSALVKLVEAEGYRVERGDCGAAYGFTRSQDKLVQVRPELSEAQAVSVLAHELAHIKLGHVLESFDYRACRGVAEVEAESVAFVVGASLGLSTDDPFAFQYVAGWAKEDEAPVRKVAERVLKVARAILEAVEAAQDLEAAQVA